MCTFVRPTSIQNAHNRAIEISTYRKSELKRKKNWLLAQITNIILFSFLCIFFSLLLIVATILFIHSSPFFHSFCCARNIMAVCSWLILWKIVELHVYVVSIVFWGYEMAEMPLTVCAFLVIRLVSFRKTTHSFVTIHYKFTAIWCTNTNALFCLAGEWMQDNQWHRCSMYKLDCWNGPSVVYYLNTNYYSIRARVVCCVTATAVDCRLCTVLWSITKRVIIYYVRMAIRVIR